MAEFWGYPDCNCHAQWKVHDTTWYKRSNYREVWNKPQFVAELNGDDERWLVSWDQAFGDVPCVEKRKSILHVSCVTLTCTQKNRSTHVVGQSCYHVIAGYIRIVLLATTPASLKRFSPPPEKNHPRQSKIPVCIARAPGLAAWKVGWDNVAPLWRRHANDDM